MQVGDHKPTKERALWLVVCHRVTQALAPVLILYALVGGPSMALRFKFAHSRIRVLPALLNSLLTPHYLIAAHSEKYYNYLAWWAEVGGYAGARIPYSAYRKQYIDD